MIRLRKKSLTMNLPAPVIVRVSEDISVHAIPQRTAMQGSLRRLVRKIAKQHEALSLVSSRREFLTQFSAKNTLPLFVSCFPVATLLLARSTCS
jgi:hypothetical protein